MSTDQAGPSEGRPEAAPPTNDLTRPNDGETPLDPDQDEDRLTATAKPVEVDDRLSDASTEAAEAAERDAERDLARESSAAEDAECVERSLAGDASAFETLVRKYNRQAIVVSYRLLGNHDDAKDVVQDAFVKAYRSLDTLERPAAFGGWLLRIVTNLSLNFRRGRSLRVAGTIDNGFGEARGDDDLSPEKPMPGHGGEDFARQDCPQRAAHGRELGDALRKALQLLPEKQRNALLLFTIEELPQREVADRLSCSIEAVKWHVFQARKKLKDLLRDDL